MAVYFTPYRDSFDELNKNLGDAYDTLSKVRSQRLQNQQFGEQQREFDKTSGLAQNEFDFRRKLGEAEEARRANDWQQIQATKAAQADALKNSFVPGSEKSIPASLPEHMDSPVFSDLIKSVMNDPTKRAALLSPDAEPTPEAQAQAVGATPTGVPAGAGSTQPPAKGEGVLPDPKMNAAGYLDPMFRNLAQGLFYPTAEQYKKADASGGLPNSAMTPEQEVAAAQNKVKLLNRYRTEQAPTESAPAPASTAGFTPAPGVNMDDVNAQSRQLSEMKHTLMSQGLTDKMIQDALAQQDTYNKYLKQVDAAKALPPTIEKTPAHFMSAGEMTPEFINSVIKQSLSSGADVSDVLKSLPGISADINTLQGRSNLLAQSPDFKTLMDVGAATGVNGMAYIDPQTGKFDMQSYMSDVGDRQAQTYEAQLGALQAKAAADLYSAGGNKAKIAAMSPDDRARLEKAATDITKYDQNIIQLEQAKKVIDDPKVSTADKISKANSIAKILNTTGGDDAVSADEAHRLLNFVHSNFMNPMGLVDPSQKVFGTNMKAFSNQIQEQINKVNAVREGLHTTMDTIHKTYGLDASPLSAESIPSVSTSKAAAAAKWLEQNPKDPRAADVRAKLATMGR
jgi:hypothetical protein